jgi:hypothetical protein
MDLDPTAHTVLLAIHATAGSVGLLLGPIVFVHESRRLAAGAQRPTGRSSNAYDTAVFVVCVSGRPGRVGAPRRLTVDPRGRRTARPVRRCWCRSARR